MLFWCINIFIVTSTWVKLIFFILLLIFILKVKLLKLILILEIKKWVLLLNLIIIIISLLIIIHIIEEIELRLSIRWTWFIHIIEKIRWWIEMQKIDFFLLGVVLVLEWFVLLIFICVQIYQLIIIILLFFWRFNWFTIWLKPSCTS